MSRRGGALKMQTKAKSPNGSAKTRPHSVRTTESLWLSAKRRADQDGVSMTYMISEILDGYQRGLVNLPSANAGDSTAKRESSRSVRTTDDLWEAAKRRASDQGLTMNGVIVAILQGYSRGLVDLPKVTKSFITAKKG